MSTSKVPICNQNEICIPSGYYIDKRRQYSDSGRQNGYLYLIFNSPVIGDKPVLKINLDPGLDGRINSEIVYYKEGNYIATSDNPAGYIYRNIVDEPFNQHINLQYSDKGTADNPLTIYYRVNYTLDDELDLDMNNYYISLAPLSFWPNYITYDYTFTSSNVEIPICCGNNTGNSSNCKSIIKFPCIPNQFYICNTSILRNESNYYIKIYFGNTNDDSSSPYLQINLTKIGNNYQFNDYTTTNQNKEYPTALITLIYPLF